MRFLLIRPVMGITLLLATMGVCGDEVYITNGDRLTGTIKSTTDGKLIIKTRYIGEVEVRLTDIKRIVTDKPVTLVLDDGTHLTGDLFTIDGTQMAIRIDTDPEPRPLAVTQITEINPTISPRLKITGQMNAGFERDRGNTDEDKYYIDAEMVLRRTSNRLNIFGDADLERNNGKKTEQNGELGIKYDYFFDIEDYVFHQEWYLWSGLLFEHDKFADLNLRATVGLGPGYQIIETKRTHLTVEIGPSYIWENFDSGDDNDYAAARWGLDFKHQLFESWKLLVFHKHNLRWNIEETEDYIFTSEVGLRIPIIDGLQSTIQFNFDRDNAPAEDAQKNDYEMLITGGYAWW